MKNYIPECFFKYHDLNNDFYVEVSFESPNDCIEFFSKYNPSSIDIVYASVFYDRSEISKE